MNSHLGLGEVFQVKHLMAVTDMEKYYADVAIVLEIIIGTMVCCVTSLVLIGYFKCHGWKKPSGLTVINLLVADLINGIIAPLQVASIHCLLHDISTPNLDRAVFFLQALFLWTAPLIITLLSISRLIAILNPLAYSSIVTLNTTGILLGLAWMTGLLDCFLKSYWHAYSQYKYHVPDVLLHFIINVVILGLALYTLMVLKTPRGQTQCAARVKATKTVIMVSMAFFLTYGYYIYVYMVWMIPGVAENTENPWLIFTAIGKWSLSLAHLFILMNSLFNGVIFGLQPNIVHAIENIWVPDYYRRTLQQEANPTLASAIS